MERFVKAYKSKLALRCEYDDGNYQLVYERKTGTLTTASDHIIGSASDDRITIVSLSANDHDIIEARAGHDQVACGMSNDVISGGAGSDILLGGAGADTQLIGSDLI